MRYRTYEVVGAQHAAVQSTVVWLPLGEGGLFDRISGTVRTGAYVTVDAIPQGAAVPATEIRVSGRTVQRANNADMTFPGAQPGTRATA